MTFNLSVGVTCQTLSSFCLWGLNNLHPILGPKRDQRQRGGQEKARCKEGTHGKKHLVVFLFF
jgi:hypothetical protein